MTTNCLTDEQASAALDFDLFRGILVRLATASYRTKSLLAPPGIPATLFNELLTIANKIRHGVGH